MARRLLKETSMRTTVFASRSALLSLLVGSSIGCAQLGHPTGHKGGDGPDAGTEEATCDQMDVKTMDLTFSGTDMSYSGVPGSCWRLAGKLTIGGSVASFAKLGDLREVQDLVITGATELTSIDTKSDLKVTGNIDIENNPKLVDLGKLQIVGDPSCLSYTSSVKVVANAALTDLKGLADVTCVSGAFTIQNNVNLAAGKFDSALRLEGGVTIQDNTKMTSVSFANLQSVTHVTGGLDAIVIRHNVALTSVSMPSLKFMHGSVTIDDNDLITSLGTMFPASFPAIEGALSITGNAKLTDLGQLDHVPNVLNTITITSNTALPYCQARHVGCCVYHVGTAQIGTGNTNCGSWCLDAGQGQCYSSTN
jgi:hypothetical protein